MNAQVFGSGAAYASVTLARTEAVAPMAYDISRVTYLLGRALTGLFQKLG